MLTFAAAAKFFTATKLGRGIGIALVALAIIGGVYWRGKHDGAKSEREAVARETIEPLRKQMEADREKLGGELAALKAQAEQKDAIILRQTELIAGLDRRIADLDHQRITERTRIATLSDSEVFTDLTRRLGVRAANDATATLYPGEIRKADEIVADYSLLGEKVTALEQKDAERAVEISAIRDKQTIAERKFAVAMDYIERADGRFKDAYNVFMRTQRPSLFKRIITLGFARTKQISELKPIAPPERPAELK